MSERVASCGCRFGEDWGVIDLCAHVRYATPDYLQQHLCKAVAEIVSMASPVDCELFCPACGAQHVDAPEPENGWTNPPHRKHLCHTCGHLWTPYPVATYGVPARAIVCAEQATSGEDAVPWQVALVGHRPPTDDEVEAGQKLEPRAREVLARNAQADTLNAASGGLVPVSHEEIERAFKLWIVDHPTQFGHLPIFEAGVRWREQMGGEDILRQIIERWKAMVWDTFPEDGSVSGELADWATFDALIRDYDDKGGADTTDWRGLLIEFREAALERMVDMLSGDLSSPTFVEVNRRVIEAIAQSQDAEGEAPA